MSYVSSISDLYCGGDGQRSCQPLFFHFSKTHTHTHTHNRRGYVQPAKPGQQAAKQEAALNRAEEDKIQQQEKLLPEYKSKAKKLEE